MDSETAALATRFKRLGTTVISDVLDNCGYPEQSLASSIKPLDRGMRLAGPAICFSGSAIGETATPALSTYDMDKHVTPGAIICIAANGHTTSSIVGGLMALSFAKLGCGGIVCDGGVRDVQEILDIPLPTFTTHVTPLNSNRWWQLTGADVTITLPGQASTAVTISAGDIIVGDADGVLAVPRAIAADVAAWAETLSSVEETIVRGLKAGEPRQQVFQANPRFAHIRKLR
jgi:4-hydroxy-4-methyl-2-oxoglutarate aldolase